MQLMMRQSQRLEQTLTQSIAMKILISMEIQIRLEQRHELKQALKMLQKMLQSFIQSLRIDHGLFSNFLQAVRQIDAGKWYTESRWFVRALGDKQAWCICEVLSVVGRAEGPKSSLLIASACIRQELELRQRQLRQARNVRDEGLALKMMLRMRPPEGFGGCSGHAQNLWSLLCKIPQCSFASNGNGVDDARTARWVLAGGWAVELLTGVHLRYHHDIDTLMLTRRPLFVDTDVVHAEDYFGVISCTERFIRQRCIMRVDWVYDGQTRRVWVVRPEFLFCSKILRRPRPQDWEDVQLLVQRFAATWELKLIGELIDRNCCDFTDRSDLLALLRTRDMDAILSGLTRWR